MYPSANVSVAKLLLVTPLLFTCLCPAVWAVNESDFPGVHSGNRLSYYRWREWVLSRAAILQKVAPVPQIIADRAIMNMNVKFDLIGILDVDETQQTVKVFARMEFWWTDAALAVDNDLIYVFTNGKSNEMPIFVTVPSNALWLPYMVIPQAVSTLEIFKDANTADIFPTGEIRIVLPNILTITCRLDMTLYPFDEHYCTISLMDITFTTNLMALDSSLDMALSEKYGVAGEWDLVSVEAENVTSPTHGNTNPEFVLHMRRKTTFYAVMLIVPLVLTSYLNVLVFLLPPDLGDKSSYLVTLTISMSVFASFFNDNIPRGLVSMPRIFSLYIYVLAESFVILLLILIVLRKYKMEQSIEKEEPEATSAVYSRRKGRVSPVEVTEGSVRRMNITNLSAKNLDTIFFAFFLTANTVGIATILSALT